MNYTKGDYTKCLEDICEIWYEDNLYCVVRTDDADKLIDVLNENEQLKSRIEYLERKIQRERNSTQKQYAKWEKEAETKIKELSKENEQLKKEIEELKWNLELER